MPHSPWVTRRGVLKAPSWGMPVFPALWASFQWPSATKMEEHCIWQVRNRRCHLWPGFDLWSLSAFRRHGEKNMPLPRQLMIKLINQWIKLVQKNSHIRYGISHLAMHDLSKLMFSNDEFLDFNAYIYNTCCLCISRLCHCHPQIPPWVCIQWKN